MITAELPDAEALAEALGRWHRDHWQPLERDLTEAAAALGRALSVDLNEWQSELLADILWPDPEQLRVAAALPRLRLRQVLTQGLVPYAPEIR